ncbi:D-lactonohydrolase-like protein [Gloeophyllum trabeum ATCC 11539]|uniref:D-lactonohydrolase-like protein n=1 Tax=Gloeophyllum trabeum (strain ATCC 11539 / FP-39264 / Madison 617) TaxID=670483 RepID=S7PVG8_GLOTA|nr:D-lactonohydrolase-like protein [Gloeophyllum trabeum ATCC 11539]EPQ51631.1 D-lactonohydrolase-like protein [Gloeophyllum trabeum ATCC 11539]
MAIRATLAVAVAILAGLIHVRSVSAEVEKRWTLPVPLPPQSVYLDPFSFAVIGENDTFRNNSVTGYFNPTNATAPFFQIFDPSFVTTVLGESPSIQSIAYNPGFAFAHEAPIYVPELDEVFFTSNDGGTLGYSNWYNNSVVGKISMTEVESAVSAAGTTPANVNVQVTELPLADTIQMTNGGTGPYYGNLVLVTSGRALFPPSLALVNPNPPYNVTVLLDNYFGRQFNSLNDVKIHRQSGNIFFTDPTYGYLNQFRPAPGLPTQVYRYNPATGAVKVVADGFNKCNGVAFNPSETVAYVTDTGVSGGFEGFDQTLPATIYAFDIDPLTQAFTNRRVFAYADAGVPDGIQVDSLGNVYSGCGDGIQVWNSEGTLIGKFFLNSTSANMIFAGPGRLVILDETTIYLARIQAQGIDLAYP